MWIALDRDRVVGFRAFLRWRLQAAEKETLDAARAVDTATDPDYQGRGVFQTLTLGAVDELGARGVQIIFNTPNAQSLGGYLKMGWSQIGRLRVTAMPGWNSSLLALATARRAASRTSIATNVGAPASEVFADRDSIGRLLSAQPLTDALITARSPDFLAWRYGYEPLHYRAVFHGNVSESGLVVFRLRKRGRAVEAAICDVIGGEQGGIARQLLREIARRTRASYLVRLGGPSVSRDPFVRVPSSGPVLVCRRLDGGDVPRLGEWGLALGDVELF
jgi:GNAT superfamily N-acetyltransferase